jgi:hypothetical protein
MFDLRSTLCSTWTFTLSYKNLNPFVQANNVKYILSNNQVLAHGDQAAPSDDISQAGLIDNSCRRWRVKTRRWRTDDRDLRQ